MRAIFNARTPLPGISIFGMLTKNFLLILPWGETKSLNLKLMSHKLTILLALASTARASEINKLDLHYMCDKGDHIIFKIPVSTKTSKVGKALAELTFTQLNDSELCVVKCLRQYIKITSNLRLEDDDINPNWLILSLIKPHNLITTTTLAHWLNFMIIESRLDTSHFRLILSIQL